MNKLIRFRSKKGLTLVELIITIAVSSMVILSAYGLFASAQSSYSVSTGLLNNRLEAGNLQTLLEYNLPVITHAALEASSPSELDETISLNFSDGSLCITASSNSYILDDVKCFNFEFSKLGISPDSRVIFSYTIEMSNGTSYSGGIALQNLSAGSLSPSFNSEITMDATHNSYYLTFSTE